MLAWRGMQAVGDRWKRNDVPTAAAMAEAVQAVDRASEKAQDAESRLAIRLGGDHETTKAYTSAASALDAYATTLKPFLQAEGAPPPADIEALDASRAAYLTARSAFHEQARTVGSRRRAFPVALVVTVFAVVTGAFCAGGALWSVHTNRWLRVNGSALADLAKDGDVVPSCVPLSTHGDDRWRCVARRPRVPPTVTYATILDGGRVVFDDPGRGTHAGCCVQLR
jgi:hypothetical protein